MKYGGSWQCGVKDWGQKQKRIVGMCVPGNTPLNACLCSFDIQSDASKLNIIKSETKAANGL